MTAAHEYRTVDVEVAGGHLRVGVWEPAEPASPPHTVLAIHGITASHRAWPAVVDALPGYRVIAPDLRGRGASNALPGPYGMAAHADDVAAALAALGAGRVTVVGHSMGGFVAAVLAHRHPELVERVVLVDGGIPLPAVPGMADASPDELLQALLGPAVERLTRTFPSRAAYREFWQGHPAFAQWSDVVQQYVDYDLVESPAGLRPATAPDAVAHDSLDLYGGGPLLAALEHGFDVPAVLLRAPRGLLDEPGGMYPSEHAQEWVARVRGLRLGAQPDANHYTVIMGEPGVQAVVAAVTADSHGGES